MFFFTGRKVCAECGWIETDVESISQLSGHVKSCRSKHNFSFFIIVEMAVEVEMNELGILLRK